MFVCLQNWKNVVCYNKDQTNIVSLGNLEQKSNRNWISFEVDIPTAQISPFSLLLYMIGPYLTVKIGFWSVHFACSQKNGIRKSEIFYKK